MDLNKIKILAIDDNRDNLISLKALISEVLPQSVVYTEVSGQGGIESVRNNQPDVILLDLEMPGMDGREVCIILKADDQLSKIPVIFLTELKGDKHTNILVLEAGGEALLTKPVDSTELKAQIHAMLKIKEATKHKRDEKLQLEELVQIRTKELKNANIAALNLLEDLQVENEQRKKSEAALRESERQYAFLAGTAFDLVKFTSIQKIYEYTARKLFELLEDNSIVAIVEYDTDSNLWKMQHIEGIHDNLNELANILGFDIRKLEGNITTKYYDKIISRKLVEVEFDFPGLFNNQVSDTIGKTVKKLLSIDKMYCITFQESERVYGNITLVTKKNTKPLNADLIETFVMQVTNFIKKLKSEEALKESEEKFRNIFQNHAAAKLIIDPETGNIADANHAAAKFYGWPLETLEKMNIGQINTLPVDVIKKGYKEALSRQKTHFEWLHRKADGSLIDVEVFSCGIKIGDKEYLHSIIHDISEKKKAEEKIKLLNRAVEASSVSIVITDAEANIGYVNPYFTELTGYSSDEVLGKKLRMLKPGKLPESDSVELWRAILSGKDWVGEYQNRKKNGELYWENAVISPILNNSGEVVNFVAIKEDITESKNMMKELVAAKEKAEESDRLKTAFLYNISHEIRTPLNSIIGFGQILTEPELSEEERREYYDYLHQSGNRLMNTITDYMDMARIVSGTIDVHLNQFVLLPLFEETIITTRRLCAEKNIAFKTDLPSGADHLILHSDPEFIQKILGKLLDNAIKYTKEGSITCGYRIKSGQVGFFVRDTGCGIDIDKQQLIFEKFRQADVSNSRGYEGSGLGLTIAKGLVTLMGGEITVSSEKGKGSVFTFDIPINNPGKSIPEKLR